MFKAPASYARPLDVRQPQDKTAAPGLAPPVDRLRHAIRIKPTFVRVARAARRT